MSFISSLNPLPEQTVFQTTISDLPEELLLHIASFLPARALADTALISPQWNRIIGDNMLWRKICLEKGAVKKDESQTWREFAIVQSALAPFKNGEILDRQPVVDGPYPLDDDSPDLKKTQQCIVEYPDYFQRGLIGRADLIEQKGNILITRNWNSLHNKSIIKVYYLDNSQENFSFELNGKVTALSLKENVLAASVVANDRKGIPFETICLVDVEKKQLCSFDPIPATNESVTAMKWDGDTLYIFRKGVEPMQKTLTTLNFSKKAAQVNRQQHVPLSIINAR